MSKIKCSNSQDNADKLDRGFPDISLHTQLIARQSDTEIVF